MPDNTAGGIACEVPRKRRGRPKKAPPPADPPAEVIIEPEDQEAAPAAHAEEAGDQPEDPEWEPAASAAATAEAGTADGQAGSDSGEDTKVSPTRKSSRRRRTKGTKAGSPVGDVDAEDEAPDGSAEQGEAAEEQLAASPRKKLKGTLHRMLSGLLGARVCAQRSQALDMPADHAPDTIYPQNTPGAWKHACLVRQDTSPYCSCLQHHILYIISPCIAGSRQSRAMASSL